MANDRTRVTHQKGRFLPWLKDANTRAGMVIFALLLGYGAVACFGLTIFAWLTYPDINHVQELASEDADRVTVFNDLRSDWLQTVKDIGLTFTVTPVLTLLGTVIGYIFRGQHMMTDNGHGVPVSHGDSSPHPSRPRTPSYRDPVELDAQRAAAM